MCILDGVVKIKRYDIHELHITDSMSSFRYMYVYKQ